MKKILSKKQKVWLEFNPYRGNCWSNGKKQYLMYRQLRAQVSCLSCVVTRFAEFLGLLVNKLLCLIVFDPMFYLCGTSICHKQLQFKSYKA